MHHQQFSYEMITWVQSPLEQFEVINLLQISSPLLHLNLTFTNLGLFTVLATVILTVLHAQGINNLSLVSSRISMFLESIYATVQTMVRDQIGIRNEVYFPFIYSLFTFILVINLVGNVSYGFAPGTSAVVSIGISLIIFFGVTLLGFDRHGVHFFSYFVPAGSPLALVPALILIELMSYLARAVSLGVRLFANLVAGHSLIIILGGFLYQGFSSGLIIFFVTLLPFAFFLAIIGLEVAVSCIQAYVWCVLTCIYIKDSIDLH